MKLSKIIGLYLRSILNIISFTAAFVLGIVLFTVFTLGITVAVGVPLLLYVSVSLILLSTKAGISSIVNQKNNETGAEVISKIEEAESLRNKISYLRICDPDVSKEVQSLSYLAGEYITGCRKNGTYSPEAHAKLEDALSVLSWYLREMNEASAEKHFGVTDDTPFPDIKEKTLTALDQDKVVIKEETFRISGGLSAQDQFSIREDIQ
ncbi:MAG: hypothetical protein ACLFR1_04325 [Spirochaetia bacterium]